MDLVSSMGLTLEDKSGRAVPASALAGKAVALYFSAHWCPPCRKFTPMLKAFYEDAVKGGAAVEIIFVSGDKSEAEGRAYFQEHHGNWLMLKKQQADALSQKYAVKGIPALVVIDSKGKAVVPSAREDVQSASANAAAVVARWRSLGAGPDWRESTGATLGGSQPSDGGAAAMRAARLARFGGGAASSASAATPSAAVQLPAAPAAPVAHAYASTPAPVAPAPSTPPAPASPVAAAEATPAPPAQPQVAPSAPASSTAQAHGSAAAPAAPAAPSAPSAAELAELPETAVLRILAQSDLGTGYSLAASGGFARGTSTAALGALRCAVETAERAHGEATRAIEEERAAAQTVTPEQQTMAAALAALQPLRNGRTQERFPQLAEIFQTLEQGSDDPERRAALEAELAERAAEAAAAMQASIASAHGRVAEGELAAGSPVGTA